MSVASWFTAWHAAWLALLGMLAARALACQLLGVRPILGLKTRADTASSLLQRLIVVGSALPGAYLVCVLPFLVAFAIGGDREPTLELEVVPGLPAANAGLRSGDTVVEVGGEAVNDWDDLRHRVGAHAEQPVSVTVSRAGETLTFEVTPSDEGFMGVAAAATRSRAMSPGTLLSRGGAMPAWVVTRTLATLWNVVANRGDAHFMGSQGLALEADRAAQSGWSALFFLVGVLASYGWIYLLVGDSMVVLAYLADSQIRRIESSARRE